MDQFSNQLNMQQTQKGAAGDGDAGGRRTGQVVRRGFMRGWRIVAAAGPLS
jgi:hypothetical protein